MIRDGYQFVADCLTKFYDTLVIKGWFLSPNDPLVEVSLIGQEGIQQRGDIGLDYGAIGAEAGFQLQALLDRGFTWDLGVKFRTKGGRTVEASVKELSDDRISYYPSTYGATALYESFRQIVNQHAEARVLDIGGRDRSRIDLSQAFRVAEYIVLDIMPGDNVDIVADAHDMSQVLEPSSFDYVVSASVFEHLLMPWKVAIEINRVLKLGGKAWISTHQTIGMHDNPWDFWRISDTAWDALFNAATGFRIVQRILDYPEYILPFIIRDGKLDSEKAVGFEMSAVMVEKVGPSSVTWPVDMGSLIQTSYPTDLE